MMRIERWVRTVIKVGIALAFVGALLIGLAAVIAGDWWLAPEPWIGIGIRILLVGTALTAAATLTAALFEPSWPVRASALALALVNASFWAVIVGVGFPTTGPGQGLVRDPVTILYSLPMLLIVLVALTASTALPYLVSRLVGRSRSILLD
jgi:hypothetical protein